MKDPEGNRTYMAEEQGVSLRYLSEEKNESKYLGIIKSCCLFDQKQNTKHSILE